jgi:hypothetical protein
MLHHVHFEVVVPPPGRQIDDGGFLLDNAGGRERNPRFCGVREEFVVKGKIYKAMSCTSGETRSAP